MDTGETTTETNSEVKTEQIDDKKKASEEVSDGSKGYKVTLYLVVIVGCAVNSVEWFYID